MRDRFSGVMPLIDSSVEDAIEELIEKYKAGLTVVWFDVSITMLNIPMINPETGQQAGMHQQPAMQIVVGTRGIALGAANYCWAAAMMDPVPDDAALERNVMQVLESLTTQRASQLNGPATPSGRGN